MFMGSWGLCSDQDFNNEIVVNLAKPEQNIIFLGNYPPLFYFWTTAFTCHLLLNSLDLLGALSLKDLTMEQQQQ